MNYNFRVLLLFNRHNTRMPLNPRTLVNFGNFSQTYQTTLTGKQFVLYDSFDDDSIEVGRILVFSTRQNLELLPTNLLVFRWNF